MVTEQEFIGRVLRGNTRGFSCGTHSTHINDQHNFGAFVKVAIANQPAIQIIGLIYAVEIQDDQLVNELVMSDQVNENVLRDQRENRMIPVEIKVLNIGYQLDGMMFHSLPPRPPMSLSDVVLCTADEIYQFTQHHDYFRLILGASEVPSDDLLATAIRFAASVYADEQARYEYIVSCGQFLARNLGSDLRRLSQILSLIQV